MSDSAAPETLFPPVTFRKKPVEVKAVQFTRDSFDEVREWLGESFVRIVTLQNGVVSFRLRTLEGVTEAWVDDWIIEGTEGEFYPCKPSIFAECYEAVDA